ncbi:MAG TPA: ABC transporter permease [Vicinamibacterales bacterium]|nr:ABC transporter permease [Vicinamibacterales bacterium]
MSAYTETGTIRELSTPRERSTPWGWLAGPKLLAAASILVVWWFGSVVLPPDVVPPPLQVLQTMGTLLASGDAWLHLRKTLTRILLGFTASALLGIGIGLLMGLSRRMAMYLEVWVTFVITIPSLCWAIIALAWFGLRDSAAVFTIVAITCPPIAVNFWSGVRHVDMSLVEMARAFRARRGLIVRRVVLPQLVPYAIAATRYGLPLAWKMAIIAEMLGLSNGVGYMLIYWFHVLNMVQVFAWMLLFTSVMLTVEYLVIKPLERASLRWTAEVSF